MPTITIGKTSKRINSTSQSMSNTQTIDVKLKEPSSSTMPIFKVLTSNIGGSFYNYLSWGEWYYWIDDIIYLTNDICEIHARLDPLATFKSSILATKAMVIYGDSANWNQYIDDTRFQPEYPLHNALHDFDLFGVDQNNQGCVIMTFTQTNTVDWMLSSSATTPCGVHVAIMKISEFVHCIGDLNNFDLYTPLQPGAGVAEIIQAFQRLIQSTGGGSLLDNIQRVIWLPFDYDDLVSKCNATYRYGLMLGGVLSVTTAWYEIDQTLVLRNSNNLTIDFDTLTDNIKFLRNDRFNSVQILTPGGYSEIASPRFIVQNKLYYRACISIADGSWSCLISSNSNYYDCLRAFGGNLGVNLKGAIYAGPTPSNQIAQAGAGIVSGALAMGVGSIIGGAVTSGIASGAITKDIASETVMQMSEKSIASGIQGAIPNTGLDIRAASGDFGGSSSALFLTNPPGMAKIMCQSWAPVDIANYTDYCDRYGYPCNKYLTLSSISGYCQCAGASVNGAAGAPESALSTINSYLNSGIYLE